MSAGVQLQSETLSFPNVKETGWSNSADNVTVYSFTINHLGSLIQIVCDMPITPSQWRLQIQYRGSTES